ncbi:MAG: class II aldolase/adducin family protein [Pseudomonadota bacterium]
MTPADLLAADFRALSAKLGRDPLQVQGPGGNTSIKDGGVMWIKASGTELAQAEDAEIFVIVDLDKARAEVEGAGDGTCRAAVLDADCALRPSIETTFHAALDWPVVVHTHSIATIVHAISAEGRAVAAEKLAGLPAIFAPYEKPGLPLTREIMSRVEPGTRVIILENHGLICCGHDVPSTAMLIEEVEARLQMPTHAVPEPAPEEPPPDGFDWAAEGWIALNERAAALATGGSYYPDHVVFLGPALPVADHQGKPPAVLVPEIGVLLRRDATPSQRAMLQCLSDVLARLPAEWTPEPIGPAAEAELLNWDAEKYRQALAAKP